MPPQRRNRNAFFIRGLALLCACSLSIGSHYGSYILGPLKSRITREMGASNSEFSLLIAAFSLNSTWTPLVGGLLAARLGTALSSIIATSLILLGQLILLLGDLTGSVHLMVLGMFVFGLGISPLAVVQESIIVRFFQHHSLGVSLALGLVAGKGASFVSARTAFPLSEWNPHAPFVVATLLAALSFAANLVYLASSKWLAREAGVALEAAEMSAEDAQAELDQPLSADEALRTVAAKKRVRLGDLVRMGDVFWTYMGINVLCGAVWSPFTHLASNLIEHRYNLTESAAASQASILLAGSIVLYPICGYITDRAHRGFIVHRLLLLGSALTLACYAWLALPAAWTRTAVPALVSFGVGHGFSTLLLVLIVPRIVPLKYVSTALGAHKSIESCGSTITQTLAGIALDFSSPSSPSSPLAAAAATDAQTQTQVQSVLNAFVVLNVLQLVGAAALLRLDRGRRAKGAQGVGAYQALATSADGVGIEDEDADADAEEGDGDGDLRRGGEHEEGHGVGEEEAETEDEADEEEYGHANANADRTALVSTETLALSPLSSRPATPSTRRAPKQEVEERVQSEGETRRGRVCAVVAGGTVLLTWALFMVSAMWKLRAGTK
ncbi:MFS general substrate transporter [Athelia psychrophila]|uniref:Lysosomal dipeptide transporter MFSD1 n=1 Tax=Athelia psychrophila TaxID=1759441 RepID=A0A166TR13_9AGAM|nr:MFS general substrate transporter [Fibularhizoctonia sp. CBS 109695]